MFDSFSDYLVPPATSVAQPAARRMHDLSKTIPDLAILSGQKLVAFLMQCNVPNEIAETIAVDQGLEGEDIVNFTIEDFQSVGISITDPDFASLHDAIISYWDKSVEITFG